MTAAEAWVPGRGGRLEPDQSRAPGGSVVAAAFRRDPQRAARALPVAPPIGARKRGCRHGASRPTFSACERVAWRRYAVLAVAPEWGCQCEARCRGSRAQHNPLKQPCYLTGINWVWEKIYARVVLITYRSISYENKGTPKYRPNILIITPRYAFELCVDSHTHGYIRTILRATA